MAVERLHVPFRMPVHLHVPAAAQTRLFGILAWCALLLGPLLSWMLVFAFTSDDQCGSWDLRCTGQAILCTAACWLFGSLSAIAALVRHEPHDTAVPALGLNLVALAGLIGAIVLISKFN